MSFETKYKHSFKDFKNQTWELHLKKEDYAGSIYDLSGGASPVVITDPNEGNGKLKPIRGTQLKTDLIIDTSSGYDFKSDFSEITDREWQAILYKTANSTYLATCEITELSLTNTSTDATGSITITNIGDLATKPTCICQFSMLYFPTSGAEILNIYAVPWDEDNQSSNRKLLGYVTVTSTDTTTEDVIDKIAAIGSDFTKTAFDTFQYQQSTYDEDIDNSWNIKIEYAETEWRPYTFLSDGAKFSGATERQWIKLDLISKKLNQSDPDIINLATYYYIDDPMETTSSIATNIKDQINGDVINNVYYPTTGELITVEIEAHKESANNITITLVGIDEKGNYFDIKSTYENDTYLRIHKRTGSDYTWTDVDFSGGDAGGDTFTIEVDKGTGNETIASTIGYGADTAATIIERLVNSINDDNAIYTAAVDSVTDSKLTFTVDGAGTWTYKFSTNGASSVTPNTDTAFDTSTENIIKWIGWVIPEIYEQDHLTGKLMVEVRANDGLGDLKNFDFKINDKNPFEKVSFIDLISYALEKTGFNLNIKESFDLYHLEADSSLSPLVQVYQDSSRLNGVNCYKVLEELMIILKSSLSQIDGSWNVVPLDQLDTSYNTRVFNNLGNYIETTTRSGFIKNVGGVLRDNTYLNKNAKITYERAYRKVKIKQDYGFVDQLLKFPSFISLNENITNFKYPWQWMYDDVPQTSYLGEINKLENGYLYLNNNSGHDTTQFYLKQSAIISDVLLTESESTQYELNIAYKQDSDGADFKIIAYIENKSKTDTVWLRDNPDSPISGVSETITLDGTESNKLKTFSIKFNYPTGANFDEEPSTIYIELYQPESGFNQYKSVELKINTISVTGKKVSSEYIELTDNLSSEMYDEKINLGDIPNTSNATSIYKNAIYYYDSESNLKLTSAWVTDPDSPTNQKGIIAHLRKFILDSYARSVTLVNGTILGNVELRDIIKDQSNSDLLMMLAGGDWDVKKCLITREWLEIAIDTSGYTLSESTQTYEEDSSGSNTYVSNPSTGEETDLSNYYIKSEVDSLIAGKTGTFTGAELTDRAITINHNLAIGAVILYLYDNNDNMIAQSN
ncbi:MAG: hypothetical protein R6U65_08125, partial [Perlabentimonas sp.]